MKIVLGCIAAILVYFIGFISVSPIVILSNNSGVVPLIKVSQGVHHHLYWRWVRSLEHGNIIRVAWAENAMFWCEHLPKCSVESS
jgi:hypothetical protein